jgi:preprotein translocase subunit SecG
MGSQTAFGPRGSATLLSKATTISAVLFMVTSLSLSIMATRSAGLGTTVLEGIPNTAPAPTKSAPLPVPPTQTNPATPAPQPQQQAPAPAQPAAPAKK